VADVRTNGPARNPSTVPAHGSHKRFGAGAWRLTVETSCRPTQRSHSRRSTGCLPTPRPARRCRDRLALPTDATVLPSSTKRSSTSLGTLHLWR
jgi:hypothetical protein